MPASEFHEWMEYARLEPFGAIRDNWHTALLAYILVKGLGSGKRGRRVKVEDFFYTDQETAKESMRDKLFGVLGKMGKRTGTEG